MIPYKSVLIGIADINERNIAFNALDDESMRKEMALDGLKLVLSGQVRAYASGYWSYQLTFIEEPNPKLFQNILVNKLPECEVCQRGLFMLSQIRLGNGLNSFTPNLHCGNPEIIKGFVLGDYYDMENEYEGHTTGDDDEDYWKDDTSLPYEQHTWQKLANICCNVIANGNFNEYDKTDYLVEWELTRTLLPIIL